MGYGLALKTTDVLTAFVLSNLVIALGQAWALGREGTVRGLLNPVKHKLAPILRGRAMSLVVVGAVATAFTDIVTMTAGFFLPPDEVAIVGVTIQTRWSCWLHHAGVTTIRPSRPDRHNGPRNKT